MILETVVIITYSLALVLIFMYALAQLNLLVNYLRSNRKRGKALKYDLSDPDEVPYVTIQLPVYNELYVMERLLDNISQIDYPLNKLEIQVLDDSTDESLESTAQKIKSLRSSGLDIKHILREDRIGFKAGNEMRERVRNGAGVSRQDPHGQVG